MSDQWPGYTPEAQAHEIATRPLPKSRRCPSRCPEVGYMTCENERGHSGTCEAGGYSWYRGRGHAKPFLVGRPAYIEVASGDAARVSRAGEVPVFGRDRLPEGKRWNSPSQASYVNSEQAWARFIARARRENPEIATRIAP